MNPTFFLRNVLALAAALSLGSLAGCGDGGGGGGGPDGSTGPITVTGTVLDQNSALPLAGVTVNVGGQATATDATGQFTVANVAPPYDVALRTGGVDFVRVYRGITVANPTLLALTGSLPENEAAVSGTIALAGTTADDTAYCRLDGPRRLEGYGGVNSTGVSPLAWTMDLSLGSAPATWYGASTNDGTVHCVVERRPDPSTLSAAFYGSTTVTLADGGSFADRAITATSVGLTTVTGTITAPPSAAEVTLELGNVFEFGASFATGSLVAPGSFSRTMPFLTGTTTSVAARYLSPPSGSESVALVPAAATIDQDVVVLDPPVVTSPAASATISATDPVQWTGGGHVYLVRFYQLSTLVEVVTAEESALRPDLSAFGLAFAPGEMALSVDEYGPVTTVDEVVAGTTFFDLREERTDVQHAYTGFMAVTLSN